MELPKYTTQIGMPNSRHKIFVEDYVISYIKQLGRENTGKGRKTVLWGFEQNTEEIGYTFIYGAACLEETFNQEKYLNEQELEEAENKRKEYFDKYKLVGWCFVENELQEGIYLLHNQRSIYIEGFHIFYEKNEYMLSFMIHRHTEIQSEIEKKQEPVHPQIAAYRRTVSVATPERGRFKTALVSVFLVFSTLTILVLSGTLKLDEFQKTIGRAITTVTEKKIPDKIVSDVDLMDELKKENAVKPEEDKKIQEEPKEEPEKPIIEEPREEPEEPEEQEEPIIEESKIQPTEHIIRKGETLISISREHYGDESKVSLICETNNIEDADNIQIGQKIILP